MAKRYVIQVNTVDADLSGDSKWETVQHPAGGDWMTRSRSTAIADAASLRNAGEARELRIAVSRPVYELVPDITDEQIAEAAVVLSLVPENDDDDEDDEDDDEDDDVVFHVDGTDPDAPQLI